MFAVFANFTQTQERLSRRWDRLVRGNRNVHTGGKGTAHSIDERLRRATAVLKAFSPLVGDSESRFAVEGEELLFYGKPNTGFKLIDRLLRNIPNQEQCSVGIMVEDLPLQSVLAAFGAAIHAIGTTARVKADFGQTTERYVQWDKNVPERPGYYESLFYGCFKPSTAKFVKSGGTVDSSCLRVE